MTKAGKPSKREVLDSLEGFHGMRLTPDREFVILTSASCGPNGWGHRWCSFAHEGRVGGSLFWCDCPCHKNPVCDLQNDGAY